jgi:DNA-binding response OmpR family regulator
MARVLVVDDEAPVRQLVRLACTMEGHQVDEAFDVGSAVAAFLRTPPDLLVLDLSMPGGGGEEVLRELRFGNALGCPVMVISGYVEELSTEDRERIGARLFVPKPLTIPTLRARIAEALRPPPAGE